VGNRIDAAFRRARAANAAALMPFITAGDPDLAATGGLLEEFARRGADLVELGIPYSDPVADGATIQSSYVRALEKGVKVQPILEMIHDVRRRCELPILTMVSYSIVSRIGVESWFQRAAAADVDGVIIPELPADEGKEVARLAESNRLHPVFLVAPTTPPERMKEIAARSRGFIYYVAFAGTTGARDELPADLADHIGRLKAVTRKPVAVGFGISRPEQVAAVARVADGVIVGSALVRKIEELASRPRAELISGVGDFLAELARAKTRAMSKPV
jgi:tryptophan synthase alpha chain